MSPKYNVGSTGTRWPVKEVCFVYTTHLVIEIII